MQSVIENYPEIPDKFSKYADEIKATVRETVSFKLKQVTDLKPWQSKVGGRPYIPLGEEYPRNAKGVPFTFVMQLNFSEIPYLPGYPTEGIVEFYIDSTDEMMGMNYENPTNQDLFRVLYFKTVEKDESKLQQGVVEGENNAGSREGENSTESTENYDPFEKNLSSLMEFTLEKQYITPFDYRFDKIISVGEDFELEDEYFEVFGTAGHRIGGYPHFNQFDPRSDNFQEYELLVQLDSDYDNGIMWGDSGVGAFFIHPNDLKECNFSNVLYNWDSC